MMHVTSISYAVSISYMMFVTAAATRGRAADPPAASGRPRRPPAAP